jgi:hypothetical protein
MTMLCIVGFHKWDGCKCLKCEKTRGVAHDWSKDCEECAKCAATRPSAHTWNGGTCRACGRTRDEFHTGPPTGKHYPKTFKRYWSPKELEGYFLDDYFKVVLSLIESADKVFLTGAKSSPSSSALPFAPTLLSFEHVDALCLTPDEWNKAFADPKAPKELLRLTFQLGLTEMNGTSLWNPWLDALSRVSRNSGILFSSSVGGEVIMQLVKEFGDKVGRR